MKKLLQNKKGIEMSLQTVAALIIVLVVLFVVILFFFTNYGDNFWQLFRIGNESISNAKTTIT